MFGHYLKIAIRNIAKYKTQSIIVILSIALGMVFCSLTLMWIRYERSYDSFHRDAEDIYLLMRNDPKTAGEDFSAYSSYPEGAYLAEKYPQIKEYTRCFNGTQNRVFAEGKPVAQLVDLTIDENFQSFFDIKVLDGDPILNLSNNEVALTKTQADKLFEGGSAVGQMLFTDQGVFYIKSVIEDAKIPTSIPYDYLRGYDVQNINTRGIGGSLTFFRVDKSNLQYLAREIECDSLVIDHNETYPTGDGTGSFNVSWKEEHINNYKLLSFSKVREQYAIKYMGVELNVKLHYVYILMILGLVLIICSLTNYFTLFVTRMKMREREISLRYANGAGMRQIVRLFSTEITIVLLLSLLAGTLICTLVLPYFRTLSMMDRTVGLMISGYVLCAAIIGLISVLIASGFIAMTGRKQLARYFSNSPDKTGTTIGYKVSIGFQLAVSLCAIFCSVIISRQINHLLQSTDMGYRKHNVGYCYQYGMSETDVIAAREKLKMMPQLDKVVYGFNPTTSYHRYTSITSDSISDNKINIINIGVNRDYLDLIEVEPVAGELFGNEEPSNVVLINETLAKMLGRGDQTVETDIFSFYTRWTIKGVIKDLCYFDPKLELAPLVYTFQKESNPTGVNAPSYFLFSYKEGFKWNELEQEILGIMNEIRPGAQYNIVNLETEYRTYIKSEYMLGKLLKVITLICVIIAVSGLYSIVSLLCQKRRKEIAIRKINGARTTDILNLFIKEYLPIIILSTIAAFSIGTVIMHRWLTTYIRQTPMTVWVYLSVLLCMLIIIGLTVFGNIRRAMTENPADVIKSE